MEFVKIITGGVVGTLLMTFFSYLCGHLFSREFGEPRLLNKLLDKSPWSQSNIKENSVLGWALHMVTGIVFAWIIDIYFVLADTAPNWSVGAIIGFGLGVLGILGWQIVLSLHPQPPKLELPEFFAQLLIAHIIFALGTVLVFRVFDGIL